MEIVSSPSRIWRAIVDGKDVLKQGLIRRFGTGEDTDVSGMNWLPRDDEAGVLHQHHATGKGMRAD